MTHIGVISNLGDPSKNLSLLKEQLITKILTIWNSMALDSWGYCALFKKSWLWIHKWWTYVMILVYHLIQFNSFLYPLKRFWIYHSAMRHPVWSSKIQIIWTIVCTWWNISKNNYLMSLRVLYKVFRSNLNFWDSPQSIKKWHFGCILRIFINLCLWIFVIYIDIPFLTCFIEIQGILKIKRIWLFSWNRVISYGEKCFKHCFSQNFTFFSVIFPFSREIATINCN